MLNSIFKSPRSTGTAIWLQRVFRIVLIAELWSLACMVGPALSASAAEPDFVELRGRVVCLPEEMNKLYEAELPTGHEHIYGFKTEDGRYFLILNGKYAEAIFTDERVRQKELQIKARLFPQSQTLEVMIIKSVKGRVVHDLYYYCEICEIMAVSPARCECCQGPTELVEKPVSSRK